MNAGITSGEGNKNTQAVRWRLGRPGIKAKPETEECSWNWLGIDNEINTRQKTVPSFSFKKYFQTDVGVVRRIKWLDFSKNLVKNILKNLGKNALLKLN